MLVLSCKLVDWGEAGNGIFLLVSGGSLLRRAAGSLLTHASQTEAQTLLAQSKLEWDLRLQAWESPGYLGWREHGLNSPPSFLAIGFPVNEDQWEEWFLFNTLVDPILKPGWRTTCFTVFKYQRLFRLVKTVIKSYSSLRDKNHTTRI